MKSHPEIDNPWALSWWMADQGDNPKESDVLDGHKRFMADPAHLTYNEKYKSSEAVSASSMGALFKPHKPMETKRTHLVLGTRFLEAAIDDSKREVQVLIIKEGMGNKVDRHSYSADLLKKVTPLFDGVKAYANHPSKTEESDRPERDIKEIVGYYQDPQFIMEGGRAAITATLKIIDGAAYDWAWNLVKEAASFAKKFKDKDLVGISINAWGASHAVETSDGMVNMVDDLTEVQSADIVTQAGAGGGFRLREAVKKVLAREAYSEGGNNMDPKAALMKHGEGLKALHDQISANPEHAKAYGPAMEAIMAHHAEMMKGCEAAAPAPDNAAAEEAKKEAARQAEVSKDFEKMTEAYKSGKMSPVEKALYEKVVEERAATKIKENVSMIERVIREAGIPESYASDLPVICAGKAEGEVKKLVEARKSLIALAGDRGQGAGAGNGGKPASKLSDKLAESGIKLVVKK